MHVECADCVISSAGEYVWIWMYRQTDRLHMAKRQEPSPTIPAALSQNILVSST